MQQEERFVVKMTELIENIERQNLEKSDHVEPDVFISYCWSNSLDAVQKGTKKTPSSIGKILKKNFCTFVI